jgi:hypothetical protein
MLQKFGDYKTKVMGFKIDDTSNIYYIAGQAHTNITEVMSIYNPKVGQVHFKTSIEGDGVVLHKYGVPAELKEHNPDHIFVAGVEHNKLLCDKKNIEGVVSLLSTGTFTGRPAISNYELRNRDGSSTTPSLQRVYDNRTLLERLFDLPIERDPNTYNEVLSVGITHDDLTNLKHPILVGHFQGDGIVSAEGALDYSLKNALTIRNDAKSYPNALTENLIIVNEKNTPMGAIVVGLGPSEMLTEGGLSRSVHKAIINYVLHIQENITEKSSLSQYTSIASVAVGSSFGGLKLKSSLRGIIRGVIEANKTLLVLGKESIIIKHLEFVDYYADIARHAYYMARELEQEFTMDRISLADRITIGESGVKRLPFNQGVEWWPSFTTRTIEEKINKKLTKRYLQYDSTGTAARVEVSTSTGDLAKIDQIIEDIELTSEYDPDNSKLLFELLVPPSLKDIVRTENNLVWKLDLKAATYPWEMFHDSKINPEPTFINAGLIRQSLEDAPTNFAAIVRNRKVLVIANSKFTSLPNLPAVEEEGRSVRAQLEGKYETNIMENEKFSSVMKALFTRDFEILHIAGHGMYDEENDRIGIAFDGQVIDARDLAQLPSIPQFAFINCCHLGKINTVKEEYYKARHKIAANIGTQLIKMGVRAVIIAGWAVNDGAAKVFSETFYNSMLAGVQFGEAVKIARKACYGYSPTNTTWAAYQAYGSQWYTFPETELKQKRKDDFVTVDEVIIKLENLKGDKVKDPKNTLVKLEEIMKRASKSRFEEDARVLELEAEIFHKLEYHKKALFAYENLLKMNEATFSVNALTNYCELLVIVYFDLKVEDPNLIMKQSDVEDRVRYLLKIGNSIKRLGIAAKMYRLLTDFDKKNVAKHLEWANKYFGQILRKPAMKKVKESGLNLAYYFVNAFFLDKRKMIDPYTGEYIELYQFVSKYSKQFELDSGPFEKLLFQMLFLLSGPKAGSTGPQETKHYKKTLEDLKELEVKIAHESENVAKVAEVKKYVSKIHKNEFCTNKLNNKIKGYFGINEDVVPK